MDLYSIFTSPSFLTPHPSFAVHTINITFEKLTSMELAAHVFFLIKQGERFRKYDGPLSLNFQFRLLSLKLVSRLCWYEGTKGGRDPDPISRTNLRKIHASRNASAQCSTQDIQTFIHTVARVCGSWKGTRFEKHHHHQSFMTICFVHVSLALYNGNNDSLLFGIKFTFIGTDPSFPSLTSVEILNVYKGINYFSISYLSLNNPL